jgi:hypothetical protein
MGIMDINPQSIVDAISRSSNNNQGAIDNLVACLNFILDKVYKDGIITLKEKNAWKKQLVKYKP